MAKQNGAQFPEQSDIESLIAIVKDIELNTRHTVTGNIPKTPKYEDFIKNNGNLDMIVPMGFMMLHNDLQELITDTKGKAKHTSEDGSTTEIDIAGSIGAIAGLAGVIGGSVIVANLTKDMNLRDVAEVAMDLGDWVLNKIPVIADGISYLIDTVVPSLAEVLPTISENVTEAIEIAGRGLASTAMDVKDILVDEEINTQRKGLLKTYLNLNYAQLYEDLGYEALLDKDGKNILGIQKLTEQKVDLFEGVDWDKGFKEGITQLGENTVNEIASDVKNGKAGEIVGNTVYGFKTAKIKAYAELVQEELPQLLLTGINAIDMTTDPELLQASKDASKYYIMAYYGNLIAKMGFSVDYEKGTVTRELDWSEFYSEAKTLIGDVLNGGTTLKIDSFATSIGNALTTVVGSLTSLEMLGQGPTDAVKEGYGMYVKAYYANLIAKMGFIADFEKGTLTRAYEDPAYFISEAKTLVGDVLTGGVGLMVESVASSLGNSISTISASMTSLEGIGTASDDIKEAYGMYVKAYYANLIAGFGYDVDYSTGTLTRVSTFESVKNKVIDTVGDFIFAPLTMLSSAVGSAVTTISTAVSTSEFNTSLQNSVLDYVNQVYMDSTGISEAIDELEDFVTAFFKGLYDQISDKPDDFKLNLTQRNTLKDSFAKAMGNISANLSDTVNTEIKNKVDVTLNSVFTEARVSNLISKIESIDTRLSTIKMSMGNTLGTDVKTIADKPTGNATVTKQGASVGTDDMKTAGEII